MSLPDFHAEPNIPLLRKAVEWVEAEAAKPESAREWHQGWWYSRSEAERVGLRDVGYLIPRLHECGTAYCLAGYVCAVSGEQFDDSVFSSHLAGGESISDRAAELLGIGVTDSILLFAPRNSAADIRDAAELAAGERL